MVKMKKVTLLTQVTHKKKKAADAVGRESRRSWWSLKKERLEALT
jgi:hypothetical protein